MRSKFFSFPNSEGGQGATIMGVIGAGVPPLMGALPLVALWGALKGFSFPFSLFRFPFIFPTRSVRPTNRALPLCAQ